MAALLCSLALPATAQTASTSSEPAPDSIRGPAWPTRTVRIISPFAPGGGNDTVGRFLAAKFTEQIGGTFVVENRAGSAGLIGADLVAKSAPDGHVLLISSPEFSINPSMRSKMPYDTFKDFTYMIKAGNEPVGTPPAEFLAFVRAEYDKWAKVIKQANLRID